MPFNGHTATEKMLRLKKRPKMKVALFNTPQNPTRVAYTIFYECYIGHTATKNATTEKATQDAGGSLTHHKILRG